MPRKYYEQLDARKLKKPTRNARISRKIKPTTAEARKNRISDQTDKQEAD